MRSASWVGKFKMIGSEGRKMVTKNRADLAPNECLFKIRLSISAGIKIKLAIVTYR